MNRASQVNIYVFLACFLVQKYCRKCTSWPLFAKSHICIIFYTQNLKYTPKKQFKNKFVCIKKSLLQGQIKPLHTFTFNAKLCPTMAAIMNFSVQHEKYNFPKDPMNLSHNKRFQLAWLFFVRALNFKSVKMHYLSLAAKNKIKIYIQIFY